MEISKDILMEVMAYTDVDYSGKMTKEVVEEMVKDLLRVLEDKDDKIQELIDEVDELNYEMMHNYRRVGGYEY
jgi:hypothetical protein